jgi:DNA-binding NtrC family response regulator
MTGLAWRMSRILVVEPRNILRQAISLALFPEHEVQMATFLPDSDAAVAKDFDLVIIDSAALRDTNTSSSQLIRAVQGWKVPTIWIDDTGGGQAPARDKLVVLARPVQKDTLQSAVANCLGISSSKQNGILSRPVKERMATKEASTAAASHGAGPQIIELVDVVEEPPERRKNRKQQTKTK